jgi:hypothetical protein
MTSRELQLRPDCFQNPVRLDLQIVGDAMLWPHDGEMREQATNAAVVVEGRSWLHNLSNQDVRALFELAANTVPMARIQSEIERPFIRGTVAGHILRLTLAGLARDPKSDALGAAKKRVSAGFAADSRLSVKTIENQIWKNYRPVAHFWAAFLSLDDRQFFPCQTKTFKTFLQMAEAYRRAGETTPVFKSGTILNSHETFSLPKSMNLPEMTLRVQPLASSQS